MVDNVKETTRGTSASLVDTIKANPIPAAMVGIGLTWLMMNRSSGSSSGSHYSGAYSAQGYSGQGYSGSAQGYSGGRYYPDYPDQSGYLSGQRPVGSRASEVAGGVQDKVADVAGSVQDKAGDIADSAREVAGSVKDKAGDLVDRAQDQVGRISDRVQDQAHRVAYRSQNMVQDNPLMAGALAIALGAAAGFILPETQRENELMGEARDRLMGQASEAAQDTVQKVQQVASEAAGFATEAAKEEAKNQGLLSDESV